MKNSIFKIFLYIILCNVLSYANATEDKHLDYDTVDIYSDKTTKFLILSKEKRYWNSYVSVNHSDDYIFLHKFKYKSNAKEFYQDLGLNGAAYKLLYNINIKKRLGYDLGYSDFDEYFRDLSNPVFFDTKSPYADFRVDLARYGSFYFDGTYSRNVTKEWNIGLSYKLYTSQREFLTNTFIDNSDRAIVSNGFRIFSSAELFEKKYRIFVSVSLMKRRMREIGGIFIDAKPYSKEFLERENKEQVYLNSEDRETNKIKVLNRILPFKDEGFMSSPESVNFKILGDIYQDYKIFEGLKVFNEFSYSISSNYFEYRNKQKDNEDYPSKNERKKSKYKNINFNDSSFKDEDRKRLKYNLNFLGIGFVSSLNLYTYYQDISTISNEIGFIHNIDKFVWVPYYRLTNNWVSRSAGDFELNDILPEDYLNSSILENFIGVQSKYDIKKYNIDSIEVAGELLLSSEFIINGAINTRYGSLLAEFGKKSAYEIQKEFYWRERMWNNDFNDINSFSLSYSGNFSSKFLDISPIISYIVVNNPVYYSEKSLSDDFKNEFNESIKELIGSDIIKNYEKESDKKNKGEEYEKYIKSVTDLNSPHICEPVQETANTFLMGYLGNDILFKIRSFRLALKIGYGKEFSGLDIVRFPALSTNIVLFYLGKTKSERGDFSTGIDCNFKTSYKGDSYDPVIQQFYLQDKFNIYAYPVLDLFFNFRIDSFNMFVKWSHFNEFLFGSTNYFSSAYYPGSKMALDIGIKWTFFD